VFLRQYAKEHFATEETIMREAEYPEYEAHIKEHLYFLRHVGKLCEELELNGFSPKLSREVNYYISEWFIEHILLLDMQLVGFLNARGIRGLKGVRST
jgi:hemerythrin